MHFTGYEDASGWRGSLADTMAGQLAAAPRKALVGVLSGEACSLRQIGRALDVDKRTVYDDLAQLSENRTADAPPEPEFTIGDDGKRQPRKRQPPKLKSRPG